MPFQIVRNDITKMAVDAIVNPANPMPIYGEGTDAAIYEAAGDQLLKRRMEIGIIEIGNSVLTEGYNLPARYIIHTVGTLWKGGNLGEEAVIRNCYRTVFALVEEYEIESLAIPLLATGNYGFPKELALLIALLEIERFLEDHDIDIFLVVYDTESVRISTELYGDVTEFINENYVDEKSKEKKRKKDSPSLFSPASSNLHLDLALPIRRRTILADEAIDNANDYFDDNDDDEGSALLSRSLDEVVNDLDKTFMELVFSFADRKDMTDVQLQKKANLDRKAFSKLKCGTTKNPSKATALALAIALELTLDETKDLLSRAGLALSPCSKQDLIVRYFIEHHIYDIYRINVALFEFGEPLLGTQVS